MSRPAREDSATRRARCAATLLGLGLAGCAEQADIGAGCDLVYGDLVISEVMPNPDDPCDQFIDQQSCTHPSVDCSWSETSATCSGDDTGREWFEIYNASAAPRRLDRAVIWRLSEVPAGSSCRTQLVDGAPWCAADHTLRGIGTLPPRAYFVLGDGVVGVAPVDYSYGDNQENENFGGLTNTSGGIRITCRGAEIDTMVWGASGGAPEPEEGRSVALDGGLVPDALLNDQGELWCAGNEGYDSIGNRGTPGAVNNLCGRGACDDGGTSRSVVAPQVGELVISEVFANPAGADAGLEWLEVRVTAAAPVDLNGLTVRTVSSGGTTRRYTIDSLSCLSVAPGSYALIGASADPLTNGGVTVAAVAEGLTLYDGGTLALERGRAVIDEAQFPAASAEGTSTSLSPRFLSASGNDDPTNFCPATTSGLFAGTGTPGTANDVCPGDCWDGPTLRPALRPAAGELVITEVYARPSSPENGRDWLELYVAGAQAVELNGLEIVNTTSTTRRWTLASDNCLSVAPGSFVLLGGSGVAAEGVTPAVVFGAVDSMLNGSAATLALRVDGATIDEMAYPAATTSTSWQLRPEILTAAGNDESGNWCLATAAGNGFTGGLGSPGAANGVCP